MTATNLRSGPRLGMEALLLWVLIGCLAGGAALIWGAAFLAHLMAHTTAPPLNPFQLLFETLTGNAGWGSPHWIALAVEVVVFLAGTATIWLLTRGRTGRPEIDRAAGKLAHGRSVTALTERGSTATARRLGAGEAGPGLPIGRALVGGQALFASWEDVSVDIWGPRTGKTTARAIPAILAAPGAVLVTSNKRDIVDATRGVRENLGEVWVFDPQAVIGETPSWWWNPLTQITDEVTARVLADLFATGSKESTARTDAFFDAAGRDLLAGLLLAAALADRPITTVYEWLCDPGNDEPVELLREQFPLISSSVASAVFAPDKQRAGVYATAQQAVSFLTNRQAARWFTADPEDDRPVFDPDDFVAGTATLYAVSKEGRGTLGPLVAALTVAVCDAAERLAKRSPAGRLTVPLVGVLDEAANVCRWPDLPDLYSHYGSRGIVLMTILQSWSQGVSVWGREGMRKLWSAANIRVYGGGVSEVEFLGELAQLTGEFSRHEHSRTHARGGASTSYSVRSEKVLDAADLAAMPRGRALLLPSGMKPVLIRTEPWMSGPHAGLVRASIARYENSERA